MRTLERIKDQLTQMNDYNKTHDDALAIPADEGLFLHMQVLLIKPSRILELGTSTAYSTLWLASAANDYGGKVDTVEFDVKKVEIAKRNIEKAGLVDTVNLIHMDANSFLKENKNRYSFVFMDTEKEEYLHQFKLILPYLNQNAVVFADNAVDLADHMKDYLEYVKNSQALLSVTLHLGNGLEKTIKL